MFSCPTKEVIVFVSEEETDKVEAGDVTADEKPLNAYDRYVKERLQETAYLGIMIGLRRLQTSLGRLTDSWRGTCRSQTLCELDDLLLKQQELELTIERIDDVFVREYVYGRLDALAAARRHLSEEVRWDIESGRGTANQ